MKLGRLARSVAIAITGAGLYLAVVAGHALVADPPSPSIAPAPKAEFEDPIVTPALAGEGSADKVVARVGETVITVGELERRLAETPRSDLAEFGSTPEEVRRNYLDRIMISDALLAEEARARGLDKHRDVRDRSLGALRAMVLHDVRTDAKANEISDEDVKSYFDQNQAKFAAPKRVGIYRILVATEAEAKAIIQDLAVTDPNKGPDPKKWNDLARDKSLDKANHLRGGNLGFVSDDGTTGQAENRVDPAIYQAVLKVKDGALVPEPVKEGDRWAVVWKKQSMGAVTRSLEIEAPTIRAAIADERMRAAVQALLEKLRPELVKELNPELCDMVTVNSAGELERAKRPGTLPRTKRPANATPQENPGGLR
ncbi:MAG: peptidylprolyl isomerase [Polyangiaceae bacterium]|nr:peptidylprolyl isomerase [Polyangiaceae bacterium]